MFAASLAWGSTSHRRAWRSLEPARLLIKAMAIGSTCTVGQYHPLSHPSGKRPPKVRLVEAGSMAYAFRDVWRRHSPATQPWSSWSSYGSCACETIVVIHDLGGMLKQLCLQRHGGVSPHRGRLTTWPQSPRCAASQRAACARRSRVSLTALLRPCRLATTSPTRARGSPSSRSAARASGPGSAGAGSRAVGGGASARMCPRRGCQRGLRTAQDVCATGLWCGSARGRVDGAERTISGRVWCWRWAANA